MKNTLNSYRLGAMTTGEELKQQQIAEADERHRPIIDAYLDGHTMQEVADMVGRSVQRVQQIIARAKKRGLITMESRPRN